MTAPKIFDIMNPVLRNQGAAIIDMVGGFLPHLQGVTSLPPDLLWEGGGANECCYIRGTIPVSYGAHFLRNVCFIDKQQEVTAHKLTNLNGYFL